MKIIYFASVKQIIGVGEESMNIKGKISVGEIINILKKRSQQYSLAFKNTNIQCAVNCRFVNKSYIVSNNDEIAFFPPVTGG
tara:strand:- start:112 stop:357 length:246 start_codon:yes stop_codon:yes gene_type:complete